MIPSLGEYTLALSRSPLLLLGFLWSHVALFHALPPILRSAGANSAALGVPVVLVSLLIVTLPHKLVDYSFFLLILFVVQNMAYLLLRGSVSNHILTEMCLCASVLTAGVSLLDSAAEGRTRLMKNLLADCFRLQLAALYLISGLHKMNTGFFDMGESCSAQVISIFTLQLMPENLAKSLLESPLPALSPHFGLVLEFIMGFALLSRDRNIQRMAIAIAQMFHVMLALPLPPSSFYPFSGICVLAFIPMHFEAFSTALRQHGRSVALFCIALWPILHLRGLEQTHKEYPPYSLYPVGVSWIIGIALLNLIAALRYPSKADVQTSDQGPRSWIVPVLMFLLISLIGLMPYLGIRTYPAFAMFSNLRVEARSNHWFLPSWDQWLKLDHLRSVRILNSNLRSLQAFQIDLADYYPEKTLEGLRTFEVRPSLWICPPTWKHAIPAFKPYYIPFFELHRAVLKAYEANTTFYVDYEVEGSAERFDLRESGSIDGDETLLRQIPWWKKLLFRFRSFDPDSEVCRH